MSNNDDDAKENLGRMVRLGAPGLAAQAAAAKAAADDDELLVGDLTADELSAMLTEAITAEITRLMAEYEAQADAKAATTKAKEAKGGKRITTTTGTTTYKG